MKIIAITAGAAQMYCGSCLRDNTLAAELIRAREDLTLVPIYTPTRTDEPNVSQPEILYGGINVYLQEAFPLFRRTPRFVDRLLDSRWVMSLAMRFSVSTDPQNLGDLTISTLKGVDGNQNKEVQRLVDWFQQQPRPDVVVLPNSLMIGLAKPLKQALGCAVVCTFQGEDLFLDGLPGNLRSQAIRLIREQSDFVDGFISVSDYYKQYMGSLFNVAAERIEVVPLGIRVEGFERKTVGADSGGPIRVGYFARVAPEKGLHNLCAAIRELNRRGDSPRIALEVGGYLAGEHRAYLERLSREAKADGQIFRYHGELTRAGKADFLRGLDIFSVPCDYKDPKGLFLLEAMACGVPVVQPDHGAFPEIVRSTGGGRLVTADSVEALAEGIRGLAIDASLRQRLGDAGATAIRENWTAQIMAQRALAAYGKFLNRSTLATGLPVRL